MLTRAVQDAADGAAVRRPVVGAGEIEPEDGAGAVVAGGAGPDARRAAFPAPAERVGRPGRVAFEDQDDLARDVEAGVVVVAAVRSAQSVAGEDDGRLDRARTGEAATDEFTAQFGVVTGAVGKGQAQARRALDDVVLDGQALQEGAVVAAGFEAEAVQAVGGPAGGGLVSGIAGEPAR